MPRGRKSRKEATKKSIVPAKGNQDEIKPNLDLAFAMDCTGSMSGYILTARQNIRKIVDDIDAAGGKDVRLALVEYRDHPPQDRTFVTRKHNFTKDVSKMRTWLNNCSAAGGGDMPEAVADALNDVAGLSWRLNATKICVLVSDAPPHGLGIGSFDGFPNGCPKGYDPMEITRDLAQNGVTLYTVGCEPSINPYKQFFKSLAYLTGGQYVPLKAAEELTQVIVGGAQEEMSLEPWMDDVIVHLTEAGDDDEEEIINNLERTWQRRGVNVQQLQQGGKGIRNASESAKKLSSCKNMACVRAQIRSNQSLKRKRSSKGADDDDDDHRVTGRSAKTAKRSVGGTSFEVARTAITRDQTARMVQKARMRMKRK